MIIAATCGDPGGIGPEVAAKSVEAAAPDTRILLIGEARYLGRAGTLPAMPVAGSVDEALDALVSSGAVLLDVSTPGDAPLGAPSAEGGAASIAYLEAALSIVSSGKAHALVTAPISKQAIALAGYAWPGHTEFLGEKTGGIPVMMLAARALRFSLVTTHAPIRRVPELVTTDGIVRTGTVTCEALRRYFGVKRPRLAVMGLNPHASDAGRFGDEEARIIEPAVKELAGLGWDASGPVAPDTAPFRMLRGDFDAALAMYHEQAALPVKTLAFDEGINVTLGLPIIRTSPDHGTAYDIAGRGAASPASMTAAVRAAAAMSRAARMACP
ncbi:MAG TPA: 4-hydroxythreonine-4-phosphate dehydrogenase PdxA [Planctomycetes bacterium]|nr:4-hydroxythreonine-4-phosphate dehydrogenase PdxA [Planctomycetota bacterium]